MVNSAHSHAGRPSNGRAVWILWIPTILYVAWTAILLASSGNDRVWGFLYAINSLVLISGTLICSVLKKITPVFVCGLACLVQVVITIAMLMLSLGDAEIILWVGIAIAWIFYAMALLYREHSVSQPRAHDDGRIECPHCHERTFTLEQIRWIGPARSTVCKACGKRVSVPWSTAWDVIHPLSAGGVLGGLLAMIVGIKELAMIFIMGGGCLGFWYYLRFHSYQPKLVRR